MAPRKKIDKCGICKHNIGNRSCILCDVCSVWIHASCAGLAEEDIPKFYELDAMCFICALCKDKVAGGNNQGEISNLNKRFDDLCSKLDVFISKQNDERDSIKLAIVDAVSDLKNEMSTRFEAVKADIVECNNAIKQVESDTVNMVSELRLENNLLHLKLNRSDIMVNGLPECLQDIISTVVDLASFYEIQIAPTDITQACYISNKKAVLVRFNNVLVRDKIMKKYFETMKTQPLKSSAFVIDPNIPKTLLDKRVFLNDHFTPAAGKLNSLCRKLRQNRMILKFKLINAAKPVAKLTLLNNNIVEYDAQGCADLLRTGAVNFAGLL